MPADPLGEVIQNPFIKDAYSPDGEYIRMKAKFEATSDAGLLTDAQWVNVYRSHFSNLVKCIERGSVLAAQNLTAAKRDFGEVLFTKFPEDFLINQKIDQVKEACVLMSDAAEAEDSYALQSYPEMLYHLAILISDYTELLQGDERISHLREALRLIKFSGDKGFEEAKKNHSLIQFNLGGDLYELAREQSNNEEAITQLRDAINLIHASSEAGYNEAWRILPDVQYELGLYLKTYLEGLSIEKKMSRLREGVDMLKLSAECGYEIATFSLIEARYKLAKILLHSVKTSLTANQSTVREAARLIASNGLASDLVILSSSRRKLARLKSRFEVALYDDIQTDFDSNELTETLDVLGKA